jgi:hypothetical protein
MRQLGTFIGVAVVAIAVILVLAVLRFDVSHYRTRDSNRKWKQRPGRNVHQRVANAFQVFVQSIRHQPAYRAVPVAQADVTIWNISDTSWTAHWNMLMIQSEGLIQS